MSQDNRGGRGGGNQKGEDLKISCATARSIKKVKASDRSTQEKRLLGLHLAECEECESGGSSGSNEKDKPASGWDKFMSSPMMLGLRGKPLHKKDEKKK